MTHRYDRTGERLDDDELERELAPTPHACDRGWVEVSRDPLVVRRCRRCHPTPTATT